MDIKVLVRKGVSETLEFLGEAEKNSALFKELKEKTGITRKKLTVLADQGLLKKSDERVVVKTVPIKRKRTTYSISDMGKRLLELCGNLSEEEAKAFLKTSQTQLDVLRFFLKEGPKRARDVPDTAPDKLKRIVNRGFLEKKTDKVEESHDVYRLKRTYTLTEKGKKVYTAYKTIVSI